MQSTQKRSTITIQRLLGRLDARIRLPLLGLAAGILGGAAYTAESASHMILPGPADLYIVGFLLAAVGGMAGWLIGVMLRAPLAGANGPGEERVPEDGGPAKNGPLNSPPARDKE